MHNETAEPEDILRNPDRNLTLRVTCTGQPVKFWYKQRLENPHLCHKSPTHAGIDQRYIDSTRLVLQVHRPTF